jgi:uncharacterized protein YutE (UPF0331/DUF86 family)
LVDRTLILRELSQLEEYLKQVEEFSSITLSEYSADWKIQRIVERTLQMMIEICIDIAGHIVSDRKFRVPTSYADTLRVLMENNCITSTLFQSLERMAKFRNVVVHHYDRVDEAIVIAILKKHLSDFLLFRDTILSTLTEDRQ